MRPCRYTETENGYKFHYRFADLRRFLERGYSHGDVGPILVAKNGPSLVYESFGTIENPFKYRAHINMMENPALDGEFILDAVMNPKPLFDKGDYSFLILDL